MVSNSTVRWMITEQTKEENSLEVFILREWKNQTLCIALHHLRGLREITGLPSRTEDPATFLPLPARDSEADPNGSGDQQ